MDAMTTTQILSALLGLYFIAAGVFLLTNSNALPGLMKELTTQPLLAFAMGIIAFVIGGTILAVHRDWSGLLGGFIAFMGMVALVEGFLIIALPKWFFGIIESLDFSSTSLARVFGTGVFALGAVVLWAGVIA
jgi:uncharacterized protein YjeT (DUF2065 family)